ncbi:hypothetical protein GCM10010218_28440 [Streptomyces mashuensis]|uniref:DUF397 domain-containing protein n=1 Tax=Streptomyces mashuensis TaxID=33904 RepID=A0A919B326_9ACTN|nr:DUF397 domain-containing protein [Streptomyces mashuensis]GHF45542.1 hypothetical protein GCM10010218_28440 [Streptomyces mashuensis]
MSQSQRVPDGLKWIPATDDETMEVYLEVAFGENGDDNVYIRENTNPEKVVITTSKKWDAFVLGVRAGEFDHFVEDID